MLLELNGVTHKLRFHHHNPKDPKFLERLSGSPEENNSMLGTVALLERSVGEGEEKAWTMLAIGKSLLHPNDYLMYCKETGRKISLARALLYAFPGDENKELRRIAWQQYLNRTNRDGETNDQPVH